MNIRIGTRGSKLAMAQTSEVCEKLKQRFPEHTYEIVVISTKGDKVQDVALKKIGDKGIFVREIEEELLDGRIQLGVHSMKDMPSENPKGLLFTKCWKREDSRDALILREKNSLKELEKGAVIGTGSMRRSCQLKKLRPDLQIVDIRGNVDTRLRKMEEQTLDGIVLAAAGLKRLGMEQVITEYLEPEQMVPACAQGALALEIREDNEPLRTMLDSFAEEDSSLCVQAERSFLKAVGGSCHVPVGANCRRCGGKLEMDAVFGTEDGTVLERVTVRGTDPEKMGQEAAAALLERMRNGICGSTDTDSIGSNTGVGNGAGSKTGGGGVTRTGTVYLVGAGPGDAGLITVKGKKAIEQADCVIYDHLANSELLSYAKSGCEKIYAGKENNHHTMRQEEINGLLAQKARQYRNVVRLKGGDVYVFGRGGEEGVYLKEQGIPFVVVPGISSAIAGPAYAGIPVTHRGISKGFHVVTAHSQKGKPAGIDFKSMVGNDETYVFLMGFTKLQEVVNGLIQAGKNPSCPVAVISNATLPGQKTCVGTLETISRQAEQSSLAPPALIVVGDVVNLRPVLNFFEEKPLYGKRFLVTKVGEEVSGLAEGLREKGAFVSEIQTGQIRMFPKAVTAEMISRSKWIVLTSRHGAEAFFASMKAQKIDVRLLGDKKFAVIGKKTAEVLEGFGIYADLIPADFDSGALREALQQTVSPEETILYGVPSGKRNPEILRLKERCEVLEVCLYENGESRNLEQNMREALGEAGILHESRGTGANHYDAAFFTCASSVKRFWKHLSESEKQLFMTGQTEAVSIGKKTTQALKEAGINKITQSRSADYESMLETVSHGSQSGF